MPAENQPNLNTMQDDKQLTNSSKPDSEGHCALATGSAVSCSCWETTDNKLREKGFKISDACSALVIAENTLTVRRYLPLQRADGKKLSRSDPKGITISYCPFCGHSLLPNTEARDRSEGGLPPKPQDQQS